MGRGHKMADSVGGSFDCKPVPWLKEYLNQRGIQSSGKRKVELVDLCEQREEMKVPKIAEEEAPVDPRISMEEQLKTDEGDLANPLDNENRVFVLTIFSITWGGKRSRIQQRKPKKLHISIGVQIIFWWTCGRTLVSPTSTQ